MRTRIVPVFAAGLIVVGCGGAPQQEAGTAAAAESAASGTVAAAEGPEPAPADDAPVDGAGGTMIVVYDDAQSPEAINGRELMQENHLLEDLADDINQTLNLPYDIPLHGSQCDEANAFLGAEDFADVHSLDETRMFNLECWIYGSNPEANSDLVTDGELPEDRASGCQEEWIQLDQAWSTLLDPYFK